MSNFNRRSLIRAAGAAAFLSPFAGRFIRDAKAAPPKRFILFWHADGAPATGQWGTLLEPLPRADLMIVKDANMAKDGDHQLGMPFSTTGYSIKVDPAGKSNGPSIDMLIAKATGKPPLILTGRGKSQNYRGWISFDENNNVVLPTENPRDAYISVFGKDPGGPGLVASPGPSYADLEAAILKAAKDDGSELLARFPQTAASPKEALLKAAAEQRGKISGHLGALDNVERIISASAPSSGGAGGACADGSKVAPQFKEPESYWLVEQRLKLHVELIVASFLCDVNRVATLMVTPGGHDDMDFGYLGVKDVMGSSLSPHNNVAHHIFDKMHGPRYQKLMGLIKRWDMQNLAYLIERLKVTKEPGGPGTLFDNTLILSTSEMGHSNHGREQIPVFLSGGLVRRNTELSLKTVSSNYNQLLLGCAHAVDARLPAFGEMTTPLAGITA